ncbi:PKD domain-containing protein [Actinomadura nitritigenes]|uniref:PKD domain-containing protein n=1 Tax=Actinomadura nitritigenes TaxID=134602 RepID=UPI003D929E2C
MTALRTLAACGAAVLGAVAAPGMSASAAAGPQQCVQPQPGGPMRVTADCVDPLYAHPVIDGEKDLTAPVPHHQVSGHFESTNVEFNLYLPAADRWDGRFFQLVYPLQDENADPQSIAFGADSGAYTVQTTGTEGYRADAAAAKFSRTVAARYYRSSRRIHGYIYGGSGGSYMTIGAMENTTGVWDGAVPFIPGVPTSIPNNFFVRAFARLVLRDKAPQIADAVRPGGSGNPYAGLTSTQKAVLREVTRMGIPLRAWENYSYVLGLDDPQGLLGFAGTVRAMDPTYADDFWSEPGYLGTERSPLGDLIRAARIDQTATITRVERDAHNVPTKLTLDRAPADPNKLGFDYTAYRADGTAIGALTGSLDPATKTFTIGTGNSSETLNAVDTNGRLRIDNRWNLALLTYHRHQIPARPGFTAWDQFRDATGKPAYPQRAIEVGPVISGEVSGGGTHTGRITGKVIEVANLLDTDAFPWDADWYAQQVKQALGSRYDDEFRVWYNDNADHIGAHETNLLDYTGILQQALRDVSAWAEKGVPPPRSTRYSIAEGQVGVPATAARRRGVQPVVTLTADGRSRVDVPAGKPVTFTATIETPRGAGKIVATGWDFTGGGTFTPARFGPPRSSVRVRQTYTYTKPGTYFPALRATAQREGDTGTPFAGIPNLGRVRVVVH